MIAGGCADARRSLGVYVLGALDPAERARVEAHLADCHDCREELASLAALPGLLSRVSIGEVELVTDPAPPELLDRLLHAVGQARRHDRRVRRLAVAAVVLVVSAAGTVAGVAVSSSHDSATSTAASTTFTATDPVTHIKASVVEWPKKWGAAVEVNMAIGPISTYGGGRIDKCELVAVNAAGSRDIAASWSASGTGDVVASGATAFSTSDIVSFEVVGSDGSTLVKIPAQIASADVAPAGLPPR
jgi:Putative zinc-finger